MRISFLIALASVLVATASSADESASTGQHIELSSETPRGVSCDRNFTLRSRLDDLNLSRDDDKKSWRNFALLNE